MSAAPAAVTGQRTARPVTRTNRPAGRHSGRGLAIVIVAVVIGVLLLPSATRGPLAASASTAELLHHPPRPR
jgi:hypothetical protein